MLENEGIIVNYDSIVMELVKEMMDCNGVILVGTCLAHAGGEEIGSGQ